VSIVTTYLTIWILDGLPTNLFPATADQAFPLFAFRLCAQTNCLCARLSLKGAKAGLKSPFCALAFQRRCVEVQSLSIRIAPTFSTPNYHWLSGARPLRTSLGLPSYGYHTSGRHTRNPSHHASTSSPIRPLYLRRSATHRTRVRPSSHLPPSVSSGSSVIRPAPTCQRSFGASRMSPRAIPASRSRCAKVRLLHPTSCHDEILW
jgi:hypothetical protein